MLTRFDERFVSEIERFRGESIVERMSVPRMFLLFQLTMQHFETNIEKSNGNLNDLKI